MSVFYSQVQILFATYNAVDSDIITFLKFFIMGMLKSIYITHHCKTYW